MAVCEVCYDDLQSYGRITSLRQNSRRWDNTRKEWFYAKHNWKCKSSKNGWCCHSGLECKTFYQVVGYFKTTEKPRKYYTLVSIRLISGQQHQIRVHLKNWMYWECGG